MPCKGESMTAKIISGNNSTAVETLLNQAIQGRSVHFIAQSESVIQRQSTTGIERNITVTVIYE